MQQLVLPSSKPEGSEFQKPLASDRELYSEEYLTKQITTEAYLWDLRFWKANHNYGEVLQWLSTIITSGSLENKNCGHTNFCIELLVKEYKYSIEKAAALIMNNKIVIYKEQLGALV